MLNFIQDSGGIYAGSYDCKQLLFCVSALCLQYVLPGDGICVEGLYNVKKKVLMPDNQRYFCQIQVVSIYLCCCSRQPQAVLLINNRHDFCSYLETAHLRSVLHHCWVLVRVLFCIAHCWRHSAFTYSHVGQSNASFLWLGCPWMGNIFIYRGLSHLI